MAFSDVGIVSAGIEMDINQNHQCCVYNAIAETGALDSSVMSFEPEQWYSVIYSLCPLSGVFSKLWIVSVNSSQLG